MTPTGTPRIQQAAKKAWTPPQVARMNSGSAEGSTYAYPAPEAAYYRS